MEEWELNRRYFFILFFTPPARWNVKHPKRSVSLSFLLPLLLMMAMVFLLSFSRTLLQLFFSSFPILSRFLFLSFNHSREFLSLPVTLKIRQKKLFFSPGSRWTFIITFYCLFIFLLCLLDTKKSAPRSDGCSACYTIPLTSHPDVKLVSD